MMYCRGSGSDSAPMNAARWKKIIKGKPSTKIVATENIPEVMLNISDLNPIKGRMGLKARNKHSCCNYFTWAINLLLEKSTTSQCMGGGGVTAYLILPEHHYCTPHEFEGDHLEPV